MTGDDEKPTSWMAYELPLSEELRLEAAIREVIAHPETDKVRDLCAKLMRQNFHQQQLLKKAIERISHLELVFYLGASGGPEYADSFLAMAREICDEFGIS